MRANIERAFGKLVHRWGMLRKPLSHMRAINKKTSIAMSLCKLHDCYINERLKNTSATDDEDVVPNASDDALNLAFSSAIPLEINENGMNDCSPESALHGGEHFDDFTRNDRLSCLNSFGLNCHAPRQMLLRMVTDQDLHRPSVSN